MKVAQHWRLNNVRYQMNATVDNNGDVNFPPRPDMPQRTETRYVFVEKQPEVSAATSGEKLVGVA